VFDAAGRPTNIITQSLGQQDPVRPHVLTLPLLPGTYLMCSDGVSGMMSPDELTSAALQDDLDHCAARIIETTRANGAEDNFSFLIVDVAPVD
jgi:serine/threonine protein phosphatase PrpC